MNTEKQDSKTETLCGKANVKVWFFCSFHGSCIYKGVGRLCSHKDYCSSKKAKT
jgi:hypothetical protein